MKHFVLRNARKGAMIAGVLCLVLAAVIWYEGDKQSRNVQIMAENLGKESAGGSWYPANGTDYDLEARIVGHDGWVSNAINVERGDQVEFRLRIASNDKMQLALSVDILAGRPVISNQPNSGDEILATFNSSGLTWISDASGRYQSPDLLHVAYLPIGIYQIEDNWLRDTTGAYTFGTVCANRDEMFYRKILIVPPYSEVDFLMIRNLILASLLCFSILVPIISYIYYRYEKKCYAWS